MVTKLNWKEIKHIDLMNDTGSIKLATDPEVYYEDVKHWPLKLVAVPKQTNQVGDLLKGRAVFTPNIGVVYTNVEQTAPGTYYATATIEDGYDWEDDYTARSRQVQYTIVKVDAAASLIVSDGTHSSRFIIEVSGYDGNGRYSWGSVLEAGAYTLNDLMPSQIPGIKITQYNGNVYFNGVNVTNSSNSKITSMDLFSSGIFTVNQTKLLQMPTFWNVQAGFTQNDVKFDIHRNAAAEIVGSGSNYQDFKPRYTNDGSDTWWWNNWYELPDNEDWTKIDYNSTRRLSWSYVSKSIRYTVASNAGSTSYTINTYTLAGYENADDLDWATYLAWSGHNTNFTLDGNYVKYKNGAHLTMNGYKVDVTEDATCWISDGDAYTAKCAEIPLPTTYEVSGYATGKAVFKAANGKFVAVVPSSSVSSLYVEGVASITGDTTTGYSGTAVFTAKDGYVWTGTDSKTYSKYWTANKNSFTATVDGRSYTVYAYNKSLTWEDAIDNYTSISNYFDAVNYVTYNDKQLYDSSGSTKIDKWMDFGGTYTTTAALIKINKSDYHISGSAPCYDGTTIYYAKNYLSSMAHVPLSGTISANTAGTYTVYLTPDDGYMWNDGTTSAYAITWTVTKAYWSADGSTLTGGHTTNNSTTYENQVWNGTGTKNVVIRAYDYPNGAGTAGRDLPYVTWELRGYTAGQYTASRLLTAPVLASGSGRATFGTDSSQISVTASGNLVIHTGYNGDSTNEDMDVRGKITIQATSNMMPYDDTIKTAVYTVKSNHTHNWQIQSYTQYSDSQHYINYKCSSCGATKSTLGSCSKTPNGSTYNSSTHTLNSKCTRCGRLTSVTEAHSLSGTQNFTNSGSGKHKREYTCTCGYSEWQTKNCTADGSYRYKYLGSKKHNRADYCKYCKTRFNVVTENCKRPSGSTKCKSCDNNTSWHK